MKLELNVLVPVSTLCPPVAPNSELACAPSPVSLKRSALSALRLRYQLQPNSAPAKRRCRSSPAVSSCCSSRSEKKLGLFARWAGGGAAFFTGAGAGATAGAGADRRWCRGAGRHAPRAGADVAAIDRTSALRAARPVA